MNNRRELEGEMHDFSLWFEILFNILILISNVRVFAGVLSQVGLG